MLRTAIRLLKRAQSIAEELETPDIIKRVQRGRLTYLDRSALGWLAEHVKAVEREQVPGVLLETGCALGGSSIVIASSKNRERRFQVYDVFGQIPPPSDKDGADVHARYAVISSGKSKGIDGDRYYGYESDVLGKVRSNFRELGVDPEQNRVEFVQGLYENSLHPSGPIAFAHIDCDWYDSVTVCLERIVPLLAPGGRMVIDDYFSYSGCRTAIWDYFRHQLDHYKFVYGPRLMITSISAVPQPQATPAKGQPQAV